MSPDRKYTKLIAALKSSKPELKGKEELIEKIVGQTYSEKVHPKRISDLVFGWIEILWLRCVMAASSLVILTLFIFQQFIMFERIGKLESRMTGMNTEMLIDYQKEMLKVNSVIMDMSDFQDGNDSIKVSARDLNSLIKAYRELQEDYFSAQESLRNGNSPLSEPDIRKIKL